MEQNKEKKSVMQISGNDAIQDITDEALEDVQGAGLGTTIKQLPDTIRKIQVNMWRRSIGLPPKPHDQINLRKR